MKFCKQCGYQFSPVSSRFFCCDQSQSVCITCRRDLCKKCKNPRINQLIAPKCQKCYSRLHENDLLYEFNCGKFYCAKCLSGVFKNAYSKVVQEKLYDQKNEQIFVKMHCGHQYPYNDLSNYFEHFCLQCGRNYDLALDYELSDGAKLCFFCIKYLEPIYRDNFIRCLGCDSLIQNSSKAELKDQQGMILCSICVNSSKIEERSIQQSRKVNQNIQKQQQKVQKQKIQQKELNIKPPKPQPFKNIQQIQVEQKPQISKSTSPLNKFLKKPSISQLKQKQNKRINSKNNNQSSYNSFSVTSKFSNELEDIDDDLCKELGISKNIKMKKHLSNQTYVEHFKIQIPQNNPEEFVKCRDCNSLVLRKMCFNVSNEELRSNMKNKNKLSFCSFSTIDSGFLNQQKQGSQFLCRVCYSKSSQRDKSLLQANKSFSQNKSRSKLDLSRNVRLDQTKSSMSYLKVEDTLKKGRNSPSPSPNKEYSLTGSKHSSYSKEQPNTLKQQSTVIKQPLKPAVSKMYPSNEPSVKISQSKDYQNSKQFKNKHYPNVQPKYSQASSQSRKCNMCGKQKNSLFLTISQGYLCDQCYYCKSPHTAKRL